MHSDEGKNHSEEGYIVTPLCLVRFLKIGVLGDREFTESGAKNLEFSEPGTLYEGG